MQARGFVTPVKSGGPGIVWWQSSILFPVLCRCFPTVSTGASERIRDVSRGYVAQSFPGDTAGCAARLRSFRGCPPHRHPHIDLPSTIRRRPASPASRTICESRFCRRIVSRSTPKAMHPECLITTLVASASCVRGAVSASTGRGRRCSRCGRGSVRHGRTMSPGARVRRDRTVTPSYVSGEACPGTLCRSRVGEVPVLHLPAHCHAQQHQQCRPHEAGGVAEVRGEE